MSSHLSIRVASTLSLIVVSLALAGCAAGDPRFAAEAPAGFWVGLWHGVISWVALVIGIFADGVAVYEVHNTGAWYDFGFLFGTLLMWGGGSHGVRWQGRCRRPSREQQEWEELARKVEAKVERRLRAWAESGPDDEWEEIGKQVESKLKQKIRAWAEEDEKASL